MNLAALDDLTADAMIAATGLSYRRLDHWTTHGYLTVTNPRPGSGTCRSWPASEVPIAVRMRRLTDAGIQPAAAARAARNRGWLDAGALVVLVDDATPSPAPASAGTSLGVFTDGH